MPSYLVIAEMLEEPERRFEYDSADPLELDSVFEEDDGDAAFTVRRLLADDSGYYDGLVNADELVAVV